MCGATTARSDSSGAGLWMETANETPEHGAHLAALADPRAHPRLPARGRVGAGDARRPGRLPSAGAEDRLRRPVAKCVPRHPHALGDPVEDRELLGWDGPDAD